MGVFGRSGRNGDVQFVQKSFLLLLLEGGLLWCLWEPFSESVALPGFCSCCLWVGYPYRVLYGSFVDEIKAFGSPIFGVKSVWVYGVSLQVIALLSKVHSSSVCFLEPHLLLPLSRGFALFCDWLCWSKWCPFCVFDFRECVGWVAIEAELCSFSLPTFFWCPLLRNSSLLSERVYAPKQKLSGSRFFSKL